MPIRALIVDIGGVLLLRDETPGQRAWEERLGFAPGGFARSLFLTDLSARATIGEVTAAHVWEEMATRLVLSPADVAALRRDFFAGERRNDEFAAWLQSLRPAYRMAILSNAWSGTREAMRTHYGLDGLVDLMLFSDEEGMAKPDPRIYHLTAERLGVRPDEALFIDDVPRNVAAARALGMAAVHFRDTAQAIAEVTGYLNGKSDDKPGTNHRDTESTEDAEK